MQRRGETRANDVRSPSAKLTHATLLSHLIAGRPLITTYIDAVLFSVIKASVWHSVNMMRSTNSTKTFAKSERRLLWCRKTAVANRAIGLAIHLRQRRWLHASLCFVPSEAEEAKICQDLTSWVRRKWRWYTFGSVERRKT